MTLVDPHIRRALAYVRPYAGALVPVVVLSLLGTALNLVLPYLSKLIVDDAIIAGDFGASSGSSASSSGSRRSRSA
jgi:ABC-type bacteriocin/lantibiotic exporter with double-glycine peptidase domain